MTQDEKKSLRLIIDRFAAAPCCWLSTVRPDGRPHATPIWHVWRNGLIFLVTQANAVKAKNIRTNPGVVITHPDPLNVIIFEGSARLLPEISPDLHTDFKTKYDWEIATDAAYQTFLEITPTKLMAWGADGAQARTRWQAADLQSAS